MATPVNTVASGGLPVVDVTADATAVAKYGMPVSEAAAGRGIPVTKVAGPTTAVKGATPVVYVAPSP